jgi:hypothetical protein
MKKTTFLRLFRLIVLAIITSLAVLICGRTVQPQLVGAPATPPRATPTALKRTATPAPSLTPVGGAEIAPYPGAPLCPDSGARHDFTKFHALWDSVRGCHYDHEHGQNPFTPAVARAFPGFDLLALLGGVQVGHTDPTSPLENTAKHGGMKWQVTFRDCAVGFEGATSGVDAIAVQYHTFGDYSIEFNARVHSAVALARQCVPGNADHGYIFTIQHQDYGQRLYNYQGANMPYQDAPPPYATGLGPYFTSQCIYCGNKYDTRSAILAARGNVASTWTSKGGRVPQQSFFNLLFRARDLYQTVDLRDQKYPFTFVWMCSADAGLTYDPVGCRYNNSTTRVHEVRFIIPPDWDNLEGFDKDPRPGRVTGEGFTNMHGLLDLSCPAPSMSCFPIKLVSAYVGHTGAELQPNKTQQFTPIGLPERDIYFCGGIACSETSPGAVPSGWLGAGN